MGGHRRFFVTSGQIGEETAVITGDTAHQIVRVMRLKEGDKLYLLDGSGREHETVIACLSKGKVTARILGTVSNPREPGVSLTLAVCLPKGDKLDLIVQKGSELGISALVAVSSERCVARPDEDRLESKLGRWRRIACEATEQSGRSTAPSVSYVDGFDRLVELIRDSELPLVAWEDEDRTSLRDVLRANPTAKSILFVVGPEGGLTDSEIAAAVSAGARCVSLGRRILRSETAAIAGCAAIMYELEGEL